jgi:lysophospholipase L1-like esterase
MKEHRGMKRLPHWLIAIVAMTATLALAVAPAEGGTQMFPTKTGSRGLSAFLIKPTEGMAAGAPEGWNLITSDSFGNSALGGECLTPEKKDVVCTTASFALPKADYTVSILCRGEGKARIKGTAEWTAVKTPKGNYYGWIELGTVSDATQVSVEVAATGARMFYYGGLLAEGSVQPVNPVARVVEKIKTGGPVTVVLLGDSVTENSGGTGGGAKRFEDGNPGLMLQFLRDLSGKEVDYLAHREPPLWKSINRKEKPGDLPTVEVGGKTVYDARQELDATKGVHLVNLGKGGAAANWGWSRMRDTIVEYDYFDTRLAKGERKNTIRFGMGHYKPDLVIINFGTNDVNGSHPKWTVEDYLFHMKVLATNIQQRFGAAVILSTPHKWTAGPHLFPHRQPQMVEALRRHCRATGLALADVFNEYGPGEYDGIHPRNPGHKHMADAYKKAMLGQVSHPAIKARITAADLKDNGDGTVTDAKSGLMWAKNANVVGEALSRDAMDAALEKLNAVETLGHADWRLPTRDELLGLVDLTQASPALPKGHPFTGVMLWYQSSDKSWGVDMQTGVPYTQARRSPNRVGHLWLVRGVK